jgi:uncharacterized membrane protein YedE/YeeE
MNLSTIIFPLLVGILFGYALVKGGLTKYANIAGVFRFTDLTVLKFMLTAMITAAFGVYGLYAGKVVPALPIPPTFLLGNLVGGLIFGVGMSLAGYCPGTILAGAGEGKIDYLVAGVPGMFAGTLLYGFTYDPVMKTLKTGAQELTLPNLWNVNPFLVISALLVFSLILFYLFERGWKRKDKTA